MNDVKSDDDLNKLDMQDLRFSRPRKSQGSSGINIPPQHLIIGTTILVVLMLVIGIGSTIKESTEKELPSKASIVTSHDASSSEHPSGSSNDLQPDITHHNEMQNNEVTQNNALQDIHVPPIASSPTEAISQADIDGKSTRIELPGNIGNVLSSQQSQIDSVSQSLMSESATPPVEKTAAPEKSTTHKQKEKKTRSTTSETGSKLAPVGNEGMLKKLPSSHFTLQLSSASRSDTLEAFARQQKLKNYQVYETQRNHKPWFVLISGNYASSSAAKKAIATLPAEVQAQKPWVKSMRQVHQQLKK